MWNRLFCEQSVLEMACPQSLIALQSPVGKSESTLLVGQWYISDDSRQVLRKVGSQGHLFLSGYASLDLSVCQTLYCGLPIVDGGRVVCGKIF